jgi:hypothetical protein
MEIIRSPIKGMYRDVLKGPDGRLIYDSGWVSNTIVNGCHVLLAEFMKNTRQADKTPSAGGIRCLIVGQGKKEWDTAGTPAPDGSENCLLDPYRKPLEPLEFAYLDDLDEEVLSPTDRLQITARLGPGFPDGSACPLREFGLFASLDGRDWMVNLIRHPLILKEAEMTLVRVVRLYF